MAATGAVAALLRFAAAGLACALAGCVNLTIDNPQAGNTYVSPVDLWISGQQRLEAGSLQIWLDGNLVTAPLQYSGNTSVSLALPGAVGPHQLRVAARVWDPLYQRWQPRNAELDFSFGVPGALSLSLQPDPLILLPGATGQVQVTVSRSGAFNGRVTVNAMGEPGVVIPPGSTQATVPLPVAAEAWAGEGTRSIGASGSLYQSFLHADASLRLRVGHAPGSGVFRRAGRAAISTGQSGTAPDGVSTVRVIDGSPSTTRYVANFHLYGQAVVPSYGFEPGSPAVGGPGFCEGGQAAYVLSGGDATHDHVFHFLLMADPFLRQQYSVRATTPTGAAVEPALFFSSRCGLALVVGANDSAAPALRAHVIDLQRRRQLCTVPFAGPVADLRATLQAPAGDNQRVSITAGGQTTDCLLF